MEESEIIQHLHCYTVLLSTANVDFNSGLSIPERDVIMEKKRFAADQEIQKL